MSLFKKNKPTMKDLEKQGKVMTTEKERTVEEIESELTDARLRETKKTPEPPRPITKENTAEGFTVPKFPNNENLKKETTLEQLAKLVDDNYLTIQEAYLNLINRLSLLETRLRRDQDTINDIWKVVHDIKELLDNEANTVDEEKTPPQQDAKEKQTKEKTSK